MVILSFALHIESINKSYMNKRDLLCKKDEIISTKPEKPKQ